VIKLYESKEGVTEGFSPWSESAEGGRAEIPLTGPDVRGGVVVRAGEKQKYSRKIERKEGGGRGS